MKDTTDSSLRPTQRLLTLSNYLSMSPKSYDEIAKFLALNTFFDQRVSALYIGELIETGVICVVGAFGWSTSEYNAFIDFPIDQKYPLSESIRSQQIVAIENSESFATDYPLMKIFSRSGRWVFNASIPAHPIGGITFYADEICEMDLETELFFIAVGSLIGLYASRLPLALVDVARKVRQEIDLPAIPLTDRQVVIAGLLERGFNNAQIGLEIGYSESLVRQETVAIYRKLQVTGRQAMQAIRRLKLDNEASSEEGQE